MNKTYKSIGLMSGTSLDGVDLVYSEIISAEKFVYRIIHAKTYEYSIEWLQRLKDAFTASKKELFDLDISYGKYLGELVVEFKKEFQLYLQRQTASATRRLGRREAPSHLTASPLRADSARKRQ